MHSIRGGLVARIYAFAASNNDTGGRKSRIRRSKEERKTMVESFIKKYQIANGGDFPSLNLTHKEVGGSFYTVREIVREIIQENRVLAPPKKQDQFDFLEQNPLGSISVEPEISFSVSHGVQSETLNGSVNRMFHESDTSKLGNDIDGLREGTDKDEGSDSTGHALPNNSQHTTVGEDLKTRGQSHQPEEIIAVNEAVQENAHFDKPHVTDDVPINDVEDVGSALELDHALSELGNQKVPSELQINQDLTADKTKESGERIYKESEVTQIVDVKASGSNDTDQSNVNGSLANSSVVVETFPLRPVARTVTVKDDDDKHVSVQSSPVSGNKKVEIKLPGSDMKLNDEPSSKSVKHSSSESAAVNVHDPTKQLEFKDSLQPQVKVSSLKTSVGSKTMKDISSTSANQSSPTLDRVHLETWKGISKKSTEPETNPLLAFVKALISAWTNLWT